MDPTQALRELGLAERPRLVLWPDDAPAPAAPSVALLAGSFDPVTVAHLALSEAAREHAALVVALYSARTLPKEPGTPPPLLDERERIETLAAACAGREGLAAGLCSHGLLADQVTAAAGRFPGADLFVVLGSDKLSQLLDPAWYEDRERALASLFSSATVLYATRRGEEELAARAVAEAVALGWGARIRRLDVPPDVASVAARDVRDRARRGDDVSALVPAEALGAVVAAVWREDATRGGPTTRPTARP
ncbi:MAG: adenylyltransferase/cytidyltransferase family protein [Actinomycetota bacterium]